MPALQFNRMPPATRWNARRAEIAIGAGYLFPTTFENEVYSDLTGERGVLMGASGGVMEAHTTDFASTDIRHRKPSMKRWKNLRSRLFAWWAKWHGLDVCQLFHHRRARRVGLEDKFRDAVAPVFDVLYRSVVAGEETRIVLEKNSDPKYRENPDAELKVIRESEMWQAGAAVRSLRPENWKK